MDYAPDFPIRTPGLLADVNNFVPDVSGNYQTAPILEVFTSAIITAGGVISASAYKGLTIPARIIAGTNTKLYTAADGFSGAWTDTSATTYSVATSGFWTFATFGDALIAANGNSVLQLQTSIPSGGTFSDLAGSPRANIVFEHENALVALNINGSPADWACSDTGDYTQWSASPANNADSGTLYGGIGGPLTAGTTWGKQAIAFKKNAMYAGLRVEEIDQAIHWEKISDRQGCIGQYALVKCELGLVFVSQNDVLIYDGSKPRSIADKIRREFLRQTIYSRSTIFLSHDDLEKNIYLWASIGGLEGTYPSGAYVFNYTSGKWGKCPSIQISGSSRSYVRCPVNGMSSTDFPNGSATYTDGQANLVFVEDSGSFLGNMAHKSSGKSTRATAGKPSLTTGYIGSPGDDKTLSRVLIVPEVAGTNPESGSIITVDEAANTKTVVASINDKGMVDKVSVGRYFQATATWPTSVGKQTITDILPEFKEQSVKLPTKGR